MDPLTALSLAANVLAVVDVSAKLIRVTWQVAQTGAKTEYIEIEYQTTTVQNYLARLRPGLNASVEGLSQEDRDLILLCEQSEDISGQLLKMLQVCKAKEGTGSISIGSFLSAVKSEWKETDIKALQARLESIELKASRLVTQKYHNTILVQLASLERTFQSFGISRSTELQGVKDAINDLRERPSERVGLQMMLKAAESGGLGKDLAIQAGILDQLRFEEIDRRLQELNQRPNHEKSYLWLGGDSFGAKKVGRDPANFETWVTSTGGLYWISGVPGSGKSTLMKYLYSNNRTRDRLAGWAQGRKLIIAAYFFWEVGRIALLRTQEGLLRTLLFQILRQCPELISKVYADLWTLFSDATPSNQDSLAGFAGSQVSLQVDHLLTKVIQVCRYMANHEYCLFLVIDGLDEYEGRPSEIIQLMKLLAELPSVKLCVSSRPDNAFVDAYGGIITKVFMEQFNKPDITEFVRDRLEKHACFKEDEDRDTLGIDLINQVVDKSITSKFCHSKLLQCIRYPLFALTSAFVSEHDETTFVNITTPSNSKRKALEWHDLFGRKQKFELSTSRHSTRLKSSFKLIPPR